MFRLWARRRTAQPATGIHTPSFGPYWSVIVVAGEARPTRCIASRAFTDRDEAELCQSAWKKHPSAADVLLHHVTESPIEPRYAGEYRDTDGCWRAGQPEEITALMAELAPPSPEELALQAQRARDAWEARQPKTVVVAESGDDSPFPHHDKFITATQIVHCGGVREPVRFRFTDFDGYEPEPVIPTSRALADLDRERAELIRREFTVARRLWTQAAYRRQATPALRKAAEAWPAVAEAFARIERAWSDLDHPPHGWEVAVKQLLDAHDHAIPVVRDWEYVHARTLATIGSELVEHDVVALDKLRIQLGTDLGITDVEHWHIGHAENPTARGIYIEIVGGPVDKLDDLIRFQRNRLDEITIAAGRVVS